MRSVNNKVLKCLVTMMFISICVVLNSGIIVYADKGVIDKYEEELKDKYEERREITEDVTNLGEDKRELVIKSEDIIEDVRLITDRKKLIESRRDEERENLIEKNIELAEVSNELYELEIKKENLQIENKLRVDKIYKERSGYKWLEVFIKSEGFSDLIININNYNKIINMDQERLDSMSISIEDIDKKKKDIENIIYELDNIVEKINGYEKDIDDLIEMRKRKQKEVEESIVKLDKEVQNKFKESMKIEEEIFNINEEVKKEKDRLEKERLEREKLERLDEVVEKDLEVSREKTSNTTFIEVDEDIEQIIKDVAKEYNLPESLIKGVIQAESGFSKNAVNHNTNGTIDRGIMQLNSNTAKWLAKSIGVEYEEGIEFIPYYAIRMGSFYLNYHMKNNNDIDYILSSYNRGANGAKKWYEKNGTYETSYSKKVKKFMENF